MQALTLTVMSFVSIMTLLLGAVIGWLAKEHVVNTTPYHPDNLHPEMYDEHGNVIPDTVFAVRFENPEEYYGNNNEDEEE
jgi:hypothetical protein